MIDDSDRKIADALLDFANFENQRILEIGCGNGRITSHLVGKSGTLFAIDPNWKEIQVAQEDSPDALFQVGSGESLHFSNGSFDFVIFTLSLHHQNSFLALDEAVRVLKPNGAIIVIGPAIEGELEQVFALVHNEDREKVLAQDAIASSGLAVIRSEPIYATWCFDGAEELCQSMFDYYNQPYNSSIVTRVIDMLGEKAVETPIELRDTMVILALKPVEDISSL